MTSEPPLKRFWISSLGEYGLQYLDGTENLGGSINVTEFAKECGKTPDALTAEDWKRGWNAQLYSLVTDRAQVSIYRMWEHFEPLQDGYFRFYAGINYLDDEKEPTFDPYATMVCEYLHDQSDKDWWDRLERLAAKHGAQIEDMWTHDEDGVTERQVSIEWPVYGKSFSAAARIQVEWAHAAESLEVQRVGVI